jgi:putative transposase
MLSLYYAILHTTLFPPMPPTLRIPADNQFAPYFLTITVVDWINIFTKAKYFECLAQNLNHCIKNKGLVLYEYVIMTNHLHIIASAEPQSKGLSAIIKDFKSYTTHQMKDMLQNEGRTYIARFISESKTKKKGNDFQIFQRENYPEPLATEKFTRQKTQYIWMNPVKEKYVLNPEDWLYSSARQKILQLDDTHPEIMVPCAYWEDA